eukprot:CAMPEP_0119014406 /NCGR_PEP_ID=MMETSP1176-20130426/9677_1 /TAXON_ID=265551 /ORGANISM="Synedropsis recta cf, Strain CCMP1620" /LENGTH=59 /DNA_ID=CAMNT_0006967577 /DNA_START=251 /DNA_END=430 /DNA_ORIENTATION=-
MYSFKAPKTALALAVLLVAVAMSSVDVDGNAGEIRGSTNVGTTTTSPAESLPPKESDHQ